MAHPRMSAREARVARAAFEAHAPRDLFYRAASELVTRARQPRPNLSLAEAVAVLLQTWNAAYYRYRGFSSAHFDNIERLLKDHASDLATCRDRSIGDVDDAEEAAFTERFRVFEQTLGPVGAAKALHLLAPRLFPLWDRAIAAAYGLPLGKSGTNGSRYWKFTCIARGQFEALRREDPSLTNPLKSIDEVNYSRFTKKWIA